VFGQRLRRSTSFEQRMKGSSTLVISIEELGNRAAGAL